MQKYLQYNRGLLSLIEYYTLTLFFVHFLEPSNEWNGNSLSLQSIKIKVWKVFSFIHSYPLKIKDIGMKNTIRESQNHSNARKMFTILQFSGP